MGWSLVGGIAWWSGIAAIGGVVVLFGLSMGFASHERPVHHDVASVLVPAADRQPITV